MEGFERLKSSIQQNFRNLIIFDGSYRGHVSKFLHIWKPRFDIGETIDFSPTFHVLVRLTEDDMVLGQLFSFHGKLLLEETLGLEAICGGESSLKLLDDLENDRLQVCQGVQDLKTMNLEVFLKSCKLPLLEKIKSLFLIEQLQAETIFRSRLCNFVVYNALPSNHPNSEDFVRCSECSSYNQTRDISFYNYLKKVKNGDLDEAFEKLPKMMESMKDVAPASSEVEERNLFLRVYSETTQRDKIFNKALTSYKALSKYGLLKKHAVKVKVEPNAELIETKIEIEDIESLIGMANAESEVVIPKNAWEKMKVKDEDKISSLLPKPRKSIDRSKEEDRLKRTADKKRQKVEQRRRQRAIDRLNGFVRYPNKFRKECIICLHVYKAPSLVQNCISRHAEELNLDVPVKCPLCFQDIESKRDVTKHFDEHHLDTGKTCCCECLMVLPKENNRLRRHFIKTHHSAGKPSICPQCGKTLSSERELRNHMEDHEGNVAVCHHCGQTFNQRKQLGLHLARNHQPRDLKCPYCEQLFENKDQASRHLAMHTGIKPFKCADCNYCSYKMYNVHTHVNKTHGKKSRLEDMVIDEEARERMSQLIKADVVVMLSKRKEQKKNQSNVQ